MPRQRRDRNKGSRGGWEQRERIGRLAVRVSHVGNRGTQVKTARGEERGGDRAFYSPELQIAAGREYFTPKAVRFDEDASRAHQDLDVRASRADTWQDRPGLMAHLEAARRGEFTDIAFYKLSRMARNIRDGWAIVQAFRDADVDVHFVRDAFPPISGALGDTMLTLLMGAAQMESENIGQFISDAIRAKLDGGTPHHKYPGWIGRNRDGEFYIKDGPADVMRRLVELALRGLSYIEISRRLNADGYLTAQGNRWSHTTVAAKLTPEYIERMRGTAFGNVLDDPAERIRIPDVFPAIITEDEARILRLLYDTERPDRTTPRRESGRSVGTDNMLSGIVVCAVCGMALRASQGGGPCKGEELYPTYVCQARRDGHTAHQEARGVSVDAANLEDAVCRALKQVLRRCPEDAPAPVRQVIKPVRTVEKVEAEMQRAFDAYTAGEVERFIYERRMQALRDERARLLEPPVVADADTVARAMEGAETERQAWRQAALALVSSASFPHVIQGKRNAYRAVRVTLTTGETYLAPVYRDTYQGVRALIPA